MRISGGIEPHHKHFRVKVAFDSYEDAESFVSDHGHDKPAWKTEGVTAAEPPNAGEVLARMRLEWQATAALEKRRRSQSVEFPGDYAMLVFVADQHIGNAGTDYDRLFSEADTIAKTEGMYCASLGDVFDNFIKAKLAHIRFKTRQSIPDEAVVGKEYIQAISAKTFAWVAGNHEHWTELLTGVDYFRDLIADACPDCLYDADDCRVTVKVGQYEWRLRMRHDWQGGSIYNLTHAIERASRFDHDFDIGVGAHTHRSGVARGFDNAGGSGLAVLCGSYKRLDSFSRERGFHQANPSTAVAVLLDGISGAMVGFEDLSLAARVIGQLL